MAERTIHIEGDSIRRETEAAIRATEIELAEARGFRRAIEALRDRERFQEWCANQWPLDFTGFVNDQAADYLESLTEESRG